MNGEYYFENAIDDIENNLTGEIDYAELARKAGVSLYEFRRIFSFIAKIPIGEYVRKRRLSLAAAELKKHDASVTELAVRYGYDSPSSFSRAFKEFHGASPSDVADGKAEFKAFTRLSARVSAVGGLDVTYDIINDKEFTISGHVGFSDDSDTECCERVWNEFYSSPYSENLEKDEKIYAVYQTLENGVKCIIGSRDKNDGEQITIPKCSWAKFKMHGADDEYVNGFYRDVLGQWFDSTGFKRVEGMPNVEIYPADMSGEDFLWHVLIPIK